MQLINTPQAVADLTPLNPFARLEDGRPKVPDDLLERLRKYATTEHAWAILEGHGFSHQHEGGWVTTNGDRVLVGRAITAQFVPNRPDLNQQVEAAARREGLLTGAGGQTQNSRGEGGQKQNVWVIDRLQTGDVMVVDMFGKVYKGPFLGDNLATTIARRTGAGAVINGTVRDLRGISRIANLQIFCRGLHPSAIREAIMISMNGPLRIGGAIVLPGDVVLGDASGVFFIPPHLVLEVVEWAEERNLKDQFAMQRLAEGRYRGDEMDKGWTAEIERDYSNWRSEADRKLQPNASSTGGN
jgi:4-hydroxy-4-methyl-2-oxoglutarate aldolase